MPNAICVARMLLVAPLVLWIVEGRFAAALLVLVVAGFSDGLDGFLAKRFDWRTRLGGLLDPGGRQAAARQRVRLRLTYVGSRAARVSRSSSSARDVVIVLGAICYQWFIAPVQGEPAAISKLNTACQLAMVFFTLTSAAFAWPPRRVAAGARRGGRVHEHRERPHVRAAVERARVARRARRELAGDRCWPNCRSR